MKYKVIGWTEWESDVPSGEVTEAATQAIIDDIRENGYSFTGWDHQESMNCTPVLNDGKKRLYSQRGFGGLMAEAYDHHGSMDYSRYAFRWDISSNPEDDYTDGMPPLSRSFDPNAFIPEDISEDYVIEVTKEQLDTAERERVLIIDDYPEIRFIDAGDRVTLKYQDISVQYEVKSVIKEKDFSFEDQVALYAHEEGAEQKWQNAKIIATIHLV